MFKKDFVWGTATSSYQIEGAAYEDGKGLNIWDMYCRKDGAIYGGHNGDTACDHYHRYKEDVALMKKLGLKAYRFSLSWARILPSGEGHVNPKGIEFYNNLINELLKNDITPYITLYHWDLPLELYHKGGWLNRDITDIFANYAKIVVENFSDRVKHFITFNEPQIFIGLGCVTGAHAPGLKMSLSETIRMSHNVLLAHGKAVKIMREYGADDIKIGYAPTSHFPYPETETPDNIEAARKLAFAISTPVCPDKWWGSVTWWSDPVILGKYPEDGLRLYGKYLPANWREDMAVINQPLDFYGQNVYEGFAVKANSAGIDTNPILIKKYDGFPRTAPNWPITPKALKWAAKFLYERYKLPIYITESGLSCHDVISLDGKVHDPNRIDYMNRYLLALREAVDEGAIVAGYFAWSLMDNFEWAYGYCDRFGMVFVDYPTGTRLIKDSGYWYKSVIESNGENL
ncbi:MAG: GH1 family beta-glucosidase [Oscillospiraceae bacterium]|nr:GH1 family beta-glucosidase [Oscillospiraceae bacterium]